MVTIAFSIAAGLATAQASPGDGHWQLETLRWSGGCRPLVVVFTATGGRIAGNIWWASGNAGQGSVTGTVTPDGQATMTWEIWGGGQASGRLEGKKARSFVFHQPCGTQTARGWYNGPLQADER